VLAVGFVGKEQEMSRFMAPRTCAILLAGLAYFAFPQQAFALFVVQPGGGFGNIGGGFGNFGGGGQQQQQQVPQMQRATTTLSNPVNYWQYSSVTGVKPTIGTVRIYNQFGTLAGQNGQANQQQGGFGGGFGGLGGFGGGGMGNQLPGVGTSSGGDDPPQGVLLHVNYANLFFPNQTQLNQPNTGGGGGFGGIGGLGGGFGLGGYGGGFGKGGFGNGGSGL